MCLNHELNKNSLHIILIYFELYCSLDYYCSVAEAVGANLVVYGVLQIRRTRKIYLGKYIIKRGTTMTSMNGVGGGYYNIFFLLRTT